MSRTLTLPATTVRQNFFSLLDQVAQDRLTLFIKKKNLQQLIKLTTTTELDSKPISFDKLMGLKGSLRSKKTANKPTSLAHKYFAEQYVQKGA